MVASLSVTIGRDTVMDFVNYFYEYGSALLRKPDENEDKWRVIMKPFSWQVWLCILLSVPFAGLAAAAITSLAWLLSSRQVEDQFRFPQHSTWYTFGTVITQGEHFSVHHMGPYSHKSVQILRAPLLRTTCITQCNQSMLCGKTLVFLFVQGECFLGLSKFCTIWGTQNTCCNELSMFPMQ